MYSYFSYLEEEKNIFMLLPDSINPKKFSVRNDLSIYLSWNYIVHILLVLVLLPMLLTILVKLRIEVICCFYKCCVQADGPESSWL